MIIVWATTTFQKWSSPPKKPIQTDDSDEVDPLLEAKFDAATERLPAFLAIIDRKTALKFYGLYKQAVEGPAGE